MKKYLLAVTLLACIAGLRMCASCSEWPQWGGVLRNFTATTHAGVEAATIPDAGWYASRTIPYNDEGGNGAPVVCGGRLFLYVNWIDKQPCGNFAITPIVLSNLGWAASRPPDEILTRVEAARLSTEREIQESHNINAWTSAWIAENLTPVEAKKYQTFVTDRLKRGGSALRITQLDALSAIKGTEFANQQEFNAWLTRNAFTLPEKKLVRRVAAVTRDIAEDVITCFDAFTGDTLWDARFPGVAGGRACSSTPCVVDGRCYVLGSGHLYCVSALDGKSLFTVETAATTGSSSPLVRDGRVFVISGTLLCYDALSGHLLWKQPSVQQNDTSPQVWSCGDTTYLLCHSGTNDFVCVNPADGAIVWKVTAPGANENMTALIAGDIALLRTTRMVGNTLSPGYTAFIMSKTQGVLLWDMPLTSSWCGQSAFLLAGQAYLGLGAQNAPKLRCVNLLTGNADWEAPLPPDVAVVFPTIVDGAILVRPSLQLFILHVTPEKLESVAKLLPGYWLRAQAQFAVAYGRIYHRAGNIGCSPMLKELLTP